MCIQNLHSALDLAMTFCGPDLLDSRAWGVFQRKKNSLSLSEVMDTSGGKRRADCMKDSD